MKKNTQFITGLKALGAIMVIISHLKMQFSGYTDFSWKFVTFSAYFIVLFMCISAFTVSMSIDKKMPFNFFRYMKRRWMRIAPSYFVVLIIGLLVKTIVNGWNFFPANIGNLLYDFAFLNLDPIHKAAQAAILGVEWMLPIMFWFYLFIPVFLFSVRRVFPLFILLFIFSIFLHFNPNIIVTYTGFGGPGWSMQFYIFMYIYTIFIYFLHTKNINWQTIKKRWIKVFFSGVGIVVCIGMLLFYLKGLSEDMYILGLLGLTVYLLLVKKYVIEYIARKSIVLSKIINNLDIPILVVILIKYMINLYFIKYPHIVLCVWFVALLIAGFHRPLISRLLFENRIMQFIGMISFGIYLLHPLAIIVAERTIPMQYPWVRVLLIFPLSILGAYVLYRVVEVPTRNRT